MFTVDISFEKLKIRIVRKKESKPVLDFLIPFFFLF